MREAKLGAELSSLFSFSVMSTSKIQRYKMTYVQSSLAFLSSTLIDLHNTSNSRCGVHLPSLTCILTYYFLSPLPPFSYLSTDMNRLWWFGSSPSIMRNPQLTTHWLIKGPLHLFNTSNIITQT